MRQDAVRRAIEMQAKAKRPEVHIGTEKKDPPSPLPAAPALEPQEKGQGADVFSVLFQDSERTLLLVLLLLLTSENADPALIFALLYLCL